MSKHLRNGEKEMENNFIYIKENEDGSVTLDKTEFERIMKEKYNDGFKDGVEKAYKIAENLRPKEINFKTQSFSTIPPIYGFSGLHI